jgi:sodium-dependent phosphate cotransporter
MGRLRDGSGEGRSGALRGVGCTDPASGSAIATAGGAVAVGSAARTGRGGDVARSALVVATLYAFLVGVGLLESGIAALGEGFSDALLEQVANPVSGLFAGILLTVLVQSSSVSTSTIVGLVGAGTLGVELAVPMIMGANIGTTVTSTLAALGSIRRGQEFRRAVAAATGHDFFNLLAVAILMPLELLTGFLTRTATALSGVLRGTEVAAPGTSPLRTAVKAPVRAVADAVTGLPVGTAIGGVLLLVLALGVIFAALTVITRTMRELVAGSVERAMNRVIGRGGGAVGIVIGMLVTVAVQSSSITTSILVPLVASGILALRSAYPITLGANVGTTITALLASLAVSRPEGLTIALVHTLFNVTGLTLVWPVRAVRDVPVRLAEALATQAARRRPVIAVYLVAVFLVVPVLGVLLLP